MRLLAVGALAVTMVLGACAQQGAQIGYEPGQVSPGGSTIVKDRAAPESAREVTNSGKYRDDIIAHLERYFGPTAGIIEEIRSEWVKVDLIVVPPTSARPFWMLVTSGMSDRPMTLPDLEKPDDWRFAELRLSARPVGRLNRSTTCCGPNSQTGLWHPKLGTHQAISAGRYTVGM